ncbi:MAG: hypothetical protein HY334_04970, partial [Armatimonadetes bacterium]|nr:hypothetical protein [Armatimonadota bacterium]
IENSLDTCPLAPNQGDPRIGGDGDADGDGLDAACDPDDSVANSDEDADGYLNRQDNCPLDPNGENEADVEGVGNQLDSDGDQIGDACDTEGNGPAEPDGELASAQLTSEVTIGAGTGPGGPPECPECFGGGGGGGDGDGLSTGALIGIIVGIVAAVVVVGGAAVYMRRRAGSGGATA